MTTAFALLALGLSIAIGIFGIVSLRTARKLIKAVGSRMEPLFTELSQASSELCPRCREILQSALTRGQTSVPSQKG